MKRFALTQFPVENKTVFLRVDHNVPIKERKIYDNSKIKATIPTINYLLSKKCKIIMATHLGRPKGQFNKEFSTTSIIEELQKLLPNNVTIKKIDDCIGKDVQEQIKNSSANIVYLENLRFYKEETKDDPAFAHSLAELADVFVNDAFGVSHRKHASVHAITHFLPSCAGLLVENELHQLSKTILPKKPMVWIMGGAKMDKIGLLKQALEKADFVLLAGALPFAFLRAQGIQTGMSKVDHESIENAKEVLKERNVSKLILPVDYITTTNLNNSEKNTAEYNAIPFNQMALDIGPKTINMFMRYLQYANTIVWNGPMGLYEMPNFATGTREIGRFVTALPAATICGGGETAEFITKYHLHQKVTHLSMGGGATMAFMTGKKLPAITALEKNYQKFATKIQSVM